MKPNSSQMFKITTKIQQQKQKLIEVAWKLFSVLFMSNQLS